MKLVTLDVRSYAVVVLNRSHIKENNAAEGVLLPLLLSSIVSRETGSETESCLCDTRCTGAMDWKLECSVTYCNALRNIPRGLKEVSSSYGTKPFLMFPTQINIHLRSWGTTKRQNAVRLTHTF